MREKPNIAVTTGDPAGIGPEIVAHLFADRPPQRSRAVVLGAPEVFSRWCARFGLDCPTLKSVDDLSGPGGESLPPVVLLDTGVRDEVPVGRDSAGGGRHAAAAIQLACTLVKNRAAAAIVTAPISKKSLQMANLEFPGHTEMLAQYLNAPHCQMMMVHEDLRVVPLTRHLPLREVADALTPEVVERGLRETLVALGRDFGIAEPRVVVSGLNPHAGEDGALGNEERDVMGPVIERLRSEGADVTGPVPADAMFQSAPREDGSERPFDAYVTAYHDQGLVPFKMLARRRGVNVTVGLPVIRASVDHGTAYDIAGTGAGETASLLAAYTLAESSCHNH